MRRALIAFFAVGCGIRPQFQLTPLADAARAGDVAAIRTLIAHGADPNQPAGNNRWTPLLHAIHKHRLASVAALLDGGADINLAAGEPDSAPTTPLMMAAGYGDDDIVVLLLRRGADPRWADGDGFRALDLAVVGVPDIDRFTLFQCQDSTVRLLHAADPSLHVHSKAAMWARIKRCPV